jgi:hypothetical protein
MLGKVISHCLANLMVGLAVLSIGDDDNPAA